MNFKIKTNNKEEKRAAIILCRRFTGAELCSQWTDVNGEVRSKEYMNMCFPFISLDGNILSAHADHNDKKWFDYKTQLPQIINEFINPSKEYVVERICSNYTARVTKMGIVVGCQTVSFDKFQELVKMVTEFNQENKKS